MEPMIDRGRAEGDDVPPMGVADLEKTLEQVGGESDVAIVGMNAGKMDVAVVRFGLGEKTDEKTHQVFRG